MSLGLNRTKRRIASVKSTQKITKAMGMVATVKLKRFKDSFEADQAYAKNLEEMMAKLFAYDKQTQSHYAKEVETAETTLYIIVTSNLGLCAGYNNNLFKYVDTFLDPEKDTIAPLGEKGKSHYTRDEKYKNVLDSFSYLDLSLDSRLLEKAASQIKDEFNSGKYKRIVLVYTKYVNSLKFEPVQFQVLPVQLEHHPDPDEEYCPPLFEPSPRKMIHELLPHYLAAVLYGKLVEAQLSEQASRRSAMDNANDNADELLEKLTIEYNKARQSAITQEITEVVAGAQNQ